MKYNYCNGIDRCDLALLQSIMTPDITIDYVGRSYRFKANGRDKVLGIMKQTFNPEFVSCHTVHMPYTDLTSDTTATVRWRLLDYDMNVAQNYLVTLAASEYQDTYVKGDDGRWRIQTSDYERIFERVLNEPDAALTHFILGGGHVDKNSDYAGAKPFVG